MLISTLENLIPLFRMEIEWIRLWMICAICLLQTKINKLRFEFGVHSALCCVFFFFFIIWIYNRLTEFGYSINVMDIIVEFALFMRQLQLNRWQIATTHTHIHTRTPNPNQTFFILMIALRYKKFCVQTANDRLHWLLFLSTK